MTSATSARGLPTRGRLLLGGLGLAVFVRLWIVPLGSSFWLDEFGTWWVSNGGFGQILPRARLFPHSVLYAAIVWLTRAFIGSSEAALRLPSVLAAALSAYVLYRLGRDLFDRDTGLFAAGIFVAFPEVCFAASDARPYAFATLATIAALWYLVRWLERGSATDAAGYVLCAVAAVYFQYLFATMFVVHAAYAIRRWRRGSGVRPAQLVLVAGAVALLTVPAAALVLEIGRTEAFHAFGDIPGLAALLRALVPTSVIAALLGSFALCWILGAVTRWPPTSVWAPPSPAPDALWLLGLTAVIPAACLFGVSHATGSSVFVARYLMCMIPGQALLLAWLLRGIRPIGSQRFVVAGYLLIMILARGLKLAHTGEDWRGAVAAASVANGDHPVLLSGTFTESRNLVWVASEAHRSYMEAPLAFYGSVGPRVILPLFSSSDAEAFTLAATSGLQDRFALIERSSRFPSWAPWLEQRVGPAGYRMRRVWDGNPSVWVFERSRPGAAKPD